MRDECVDLGEAVLVEQQLEPLARRQLAARVLLLEPLRSPTLARLVAHRRAGAASLSAVDTGRLLRVAVVVGPAGIEPATVRL